MSTDLNELIKLVTDSAAGETRSTLVDEIVARPAEERQMENLRNRGVLARVYDFFLARLDRSVMNSLARVFSSYSFYTPAPIPTLTDWIENVSLSSVELHIATTHSSFIGNGIAISPYLIISALHGAVKLRQKLIVTDRNGVKRSGTVDFSSYAKDERDIAVIRVDPPMARFIPLTTKRLTLGEEICIVGYKYDARGGASLYYDTTIVKSFESEPSAMFIAGLTAYCDLSGAGAFVGRGARGEAAVVGLHVASHSHTFSTTLSGVAVQTSSDNMSYTLICEPIRVEEFLCYMRNEGSYLSVAP